jgi:hypothetical protein
MGFRNASGYVWGLKLEEGEAVAVVGGAVVGGVVAGEEGRGRT